MRLSELNMRGPQEIGGEVRDAISGGMPFVHVEGLPFSQMSPAESQEYIRTLSTAIGAMTLTAGKPDSAIWRLDKSTSPSTQFIPFHTDNPFLVAPEKVVSFWNVKSSSQGGANLILSVNDLLDWASYRPKYADTIQQIGETQAVYSLGSECTSGKLLDIDDGTARFDMKYIDETSKRVAGLFRDMLVDPEVPAQIIKLSEGDVLFFDNEKTLHARSEYSDPDRVSLRVRMTR